MLLDHGFSLSPVIRSGGAQKVPYINFSMFFNNFKDPTFEATLAAWDKALADIQREQQGSEEDT